VFVWENAGGLHGFKGGEDFGDVWGGGECVGFDHGGVVVLAKGDIGVGEIVKYV